MLGAWLLCWAMTYRTVAIAFSQNETMKVHVFSDETSSEAEIITPLLPNAAIKRIHLLHIRKAGGTSIRYFLLRVAAQHNLTLVVREGKNGPLIPAKKRNDTLYITSLREPLSRLISHYHYDGRWSERKIENRTIENSTPFSTWLERNQCHHGNL